MLRLPSAAYKHAVDAPHLGLLQTLNFMFEMLFLSFQAAFRSWRLRVRIAVVLCWLPVPKGHGGRLIREVTESSDRDQVAYGSPTVLECTATIIHMALCRSG